MSCHNEGERAFENGFALSDNPYKVPSIIVSQKEVEWHNGWLLAQQKPDISRNYYDEGVAGFEGGLKLSENPYSSTGNLHAWEASLLWYSGYIHARSKNDDIYQFIFNNFFENRYKLNDVDHAKYLSYLLIHHPENYQHIINTIELGDFAELQKKVAFSDTFIHNSISKVFNQKLMEAAAVDLYEQLELIKQKLDQQILGYLTVGTL